MCSNMDNQPKSQLLDQYFTNPNAFVGNVIQRPRSYPPLAPGTPATPIRGRKSFDNLPNAVGQSLSLEMNGLITPPNGSPSTKLVKYCKNCSFSFRIRSFAADAEFCSKDCETCFTFFRQTNPSPATLENVRQDIFEFQRQLLEESKNTRESEEKKTTQRKFSSEVNILLPSDEEKTVQADEPKSDMVLDSSKQSERKVSKRFLLWNL